MAGVVVELTGDEAKLLASMQKVIAQNQRTGESFKNVAKSSKSAVDTITKSLNEQVKSFVSIGSVVGVAKSAVSELVAVQSVFIERQKESLDYAIALAKAQSDAAKNMAGTSQAGMKQVFDKEVPDIALKTGFSDLEALNRTYGSAKAIVGEKAKELVEVAAQWTVLDQSQLQETTTALSDLMSATGGSAKEVVALASTTMGTARPEKLGKLAQGMAIVAKEAAASAKPGENVQEIVKDAIARYAQLTEVDPEGQSGATAYVGMSQVMRETFNPKQEAIVKRDDRINELLRKQAITFEEQIAIDEAKLDLEKDSNIAKRIKPTDQSLAARRLRQNELNSQAALNKVMASAVLDEKDSAELARLQKMKSLSQGADPGSFDARLAKMYESPELTAEVEANMKGEAKFLSIIRQWQSPDSPKSKEYVERRKSISTDEKFYNEAIGAQAVTGQQKTALRTEKSRAAENVKKLQDYETRYRGEIDDIVGGALDKAPALGFASVREGVSSWLQKMTGVSGLDTPTALTGNTEQAFDSAIMTLKSRKVDATSDSNTTRDKATIQMLDQKIEQLIAGKADYLAERREKEAAVMQDGFKKLDEGLKLQNDLMKKQNEILQGGNPISNTNAFREQVKQSRAE